MDQIMLNIFSSLVSGLLVAGILMLIKCVIRAQRIKRGMEAAQINAIATIFLGFIVLTAVIGGWLLGSKYLTRFIDVESTIAQTPAVTIQTNNPNKPDEHESLQGPDTTVAVFSTDNPQPSVPEVPASSPQSSATTELTTNSPQPLVVSISSPQEGATVPLSCMISGTLTGDIPEGVYLWVFVNPAGSSTWWPEGSTLTAWEGTWSTGAALGGPNSSGETFCIYVVSVNEQDNQYLKDYQAHGQQTGDYPPISLPNSAELLTRISCIRE